MINHFSACDLRQPSSDSATTCDHSLLFNAAFLLFTLPSSLSKFTSSSPILPVLGFIWWMRSSVCPPTWDWSDPLGPYGHHMGRMTGDMCAPLSNQDHVTPKGGHKETVISSTAVTSLFVTGQTLS